MSNEEQAVDCSAPYGVSSDEWHALEWQLMALVLDAEEEGAQP